MGFLFSLLMSALGISLSIGVWFGLTILLTLVLSPVYADMGYIYGPEDSAEYATWIMVIMIFFDRFFGPYGSLLRRAAKYLPSGRKTATESYPEYEYDRQP